MSEKPILFSAPMVRTILDGRKTQTRRLGDFRGADLVYWHAGETHAWKGKPPEKYEGWVAEVDQLSGLLLPIKCPYGAPGDRLWVRETWSADARSVYPCDPYLYRADTDPLTRTDPATAEHEAEGKGPHADCYACLRERRGFRWRPSIHMPRVASRITLEVTGVRVERLQAISEEDARAEGVSWSGRWSDSFSGIAARAKYGDDIDRNVAAFADLWDSINGDRANWKSNPWVWAISFRRVQP